MGDLPFPRSPLLIVTVVRLEGTVKRHIVHWMKKTSSRSHDKDQQLTCPKTINYRTIFPTTVASIMLCAHVTFFFSKLSNVARYAFVYATIEPNFFQSSNPISPTSRATL